MTTQLTSQMAVGDWPTKAPIIGVVRPVVRAVPDAGLRFRAADIVLDAAVSTRFAVAGGSVVGSSHLVRGSCRQDAFGIGFDESGRVHIVVVDGLGSVETSQVGARLFMENALQIALDPASGATEPGHILQLASKRTREVGHTEYGLEARALGCAVLVGTFDDTGAKLARVGDCEAFVIVGTDFVPVFPASDGVLNTVSARIPGERMSDVESIEIRSMHSVVLASDGVAVDLHNSDGTRNWLGTCWATPIGAYAMGDSLRYQRQGSFDDRTAVVVWRPSPDPAEQAIEDAVADETVADQSPTPDPGDTSEPADADDEVVALDPAPRE
jgi:hypothetical protein